MTTRITTHMRTMGKANRHYLYLPTALALDARFPFTPEDEVSIEIRGDTLVVKKVKG